MKNLKSIVLEHYQNGDHVTRGKSVAFFYLNIVLIIALVIGLLCYFIFLPERLFIAGPPMVAGIIIVITSLTMVALGRYNTASMFFSIVSALVLLTAQAAKLAGDYGTAYSSFMFLFTFPVLVAGLFNRQYMILWLGLVMAAGNAVFYYFLLDLAVGQDQMNATVGFISSSIIICLTATIILLIRRILDGALLDVIKVNRSMIRFVPQEFLKFLNKRSVVDLSLGDSIDMRMTVLFCDLRGFTGLTEQLGSSVTFGLLNEYLGMVGPIIRKHHGFVDKYIGDAVMAMFPVAGDGVKAAEEMVRSLKAFNKGREYHFRFGIGIATGQVTLGAIGERQRIENTAISDVVNTASRLEGLTKDYGVSILLGESTVKEYGLQPNIKRLGMIQVKGKQDPVAIFTLKGA